MCKYSLTNGLYYVQMGIIRQVARCEDLVTFMLIVFDVELLFGSNCCGPVQWLAHLLYSSRKGGKKDQNQTFKVHVNMKCIYTGTFLCICTWTRTAV